MIAPETGLTLTISAKVFITAKMIRPASRNAIKAPPGPPMTMICPEDRNRPAPTAPENAIPIWRKWAVLEKIRVTLTGYMMPFQFTVQTIVFEYFMAKLAK